MSDDILIHGLGRVIRSTLGRNETGLMLTPRGLQGWEGLPPARRESLPRALSHGDHDVPARLPSRVITATGLVMANSVDELRTLSARVTSWGATGDPFALFVTHQRQDLTARVRCIQREATDDGSRRDDFYIADFQVQFIAADPRKYGETTTLPTTSGAVNVFHRGNFPAHPVIEIPSAPSAYEISSPAGTFTVSGATSGGLHRIDMRTGRVTRNGVWMQHVGRGRVWAVPEATQWVHTMSVPGQVLITDTYV